MMRSRPLCSQLVQTRAARRFPGRTGPAMVPRSPAPARHRHATRSAMTTAVADPVDAPRKGFPGLAQLQRIGRSLMLPIASLPAAALLLRLGQDDMLGAD